MPRKLTSQESVALRAAFHRATDNFSSINEIDDILSSVTEVAPGTGPWWKASVQFREALESHLRAAGVEPYGRRSDDAP